PRLLAGVPRARLAQSAPSRRMDRLEPAGAFRVHRAPPPRITHAMPLLVHKYGGTSVANPQRIRAVAERVARAREAGDQLVVVVSAMGRTTDQLLALASEVSAAPSKRELDMLLSVGERVTMALLAMALDDLDIQ